MLERNARVDVWGRYYTKPTVGSLLIEQMAGLSPNRVLDLGAGAGSLSQAALERWENIQLLTVDVDAATLPHLRELFSSTKSAKHLHIHADALSEKLPNLIGAKTGGIDAAVCNPPFITPKWRNSFAQILEETGFSACLPVLSEVDAALLFLAQNLRLIKSNATLGIIVPDGLVSAAKYRTFRKNLLQKYVLHKAVRLPRNSFQGTDAQAHILVISKGCKSPDQIPMQKFCAVSGMSRELLVDVDAAIDRLDYEYHAHQRIHCTSKSQQSSLGAIVLDVRRGSLSSTELGAFDFPVLHTTDMTPDTHGSWCDLRKFGGHQSHSGMNAKFVWANPGDILLGRIGRNLEQKILGVKHGCSLISDCVYRIRVPKEFQRKVLQELSSKDGQLWLASRAYGVSAKQLSKTDLLKFPISL